MTNKLPAETVASSPERAPGEILGSAMRYLNDQSPKNSDAVEIFNVAWGKGFKEWWVKKRDAASPSPAPEQPRSKVENALKGIRDILKGRCDALDLVAIRDIINEALGRDEDE